MSQIEPMFPDFGQELAQEAQQALALKIGNEILGGNTANAAAGIYSRRLQVLEAKYAEARGHIQEYETDLANAKASLETALAPKPVDLRGLDIDTLMTELSHRGYNVVRSDHLINVAADSPHKDEFQL